MEPFLPKSLALRRPIDRSGRVKEWDRFLIEHSMSTSGILSWLVASCVETRDVSPEAFFDGLHKFLAHFLEGLDFVIQTPLDPELVAAYCHPGVVCHPGMEIFTAYDHWGSM